MNARVRPSLDDAIERGRAAVHPDAASSTIVTLRAGDLRSLIAAAELPQLTPALAAALLDLDQENAELRVALDQAHQRMGRLAARLNVKTVQLHRAEAKAASAHQRTLAAVRRALQKALGALPNGMADE